MFFQIVLSVDAHPWSRKVRERAQLLSSTFGPSDSFDCLCWAPSKFARHYRDAFYRTSQRFQYNESSGKPQCVRRIKSTVFLFIIPADALVVKREIWVYASIRISFQNVYIRPNWLGLYRPCRQKGDLVVCLCANLYSECVYSYQLIGIQPMCVNICLTYAFMIFGSLNVWGLLFQAHADCWRETDSHLCVLCRYCQGISLHGFTCVACHARRALKCGFSWKTVNGM